MLHDLNRRLSQSLLRATIAGLAVAAMAVFGLAADIPLKLLPFTVSLVVIATIPANPIARWRAVTGGHVFCAVAGLAAHAVIANAPSALGLAVAAAVLLMLITDTMHPPACVSTFIVITQSPDWSYLLSPCLAGLAVISVAMLAMRAFARRSGIESAQTRPLP